MTQVQIPISVKGNFAIVSLSVPDESDVTEDDLTVSLSGVLDELKTDLGRRFEVAQKEE